jgi:HAD superfamily hydrolase (TIGR01490 family)
MNEHTNIGAFFDFDRTLIAEESGRIGFRYLYATGELRLLFLLKILLTDFLYQRNLVSDTRMASIMLKFYRGRNLQEFEAEAESFYQNYLKPHLAPNILTKVREHQRAGHVLILISASVRYLLTPVAADLGFSHLLCTDLEVGADGRLTGNASGPVCIDKNKKIAAEALSHHSGINLKKSFAYGNHHSDIPLLEAVGNPSAVEPTAALRKHAESRGWPILSFAKHRAA